MNADQERLIDLGLEELLGDAAPPDLSEQILAAAKAEERAADPWIVEDVGEPIDPAKADSKADSKDGEVADPSGPQIDLIEARVLPTTLPPEYADLGPNAPEWARPGELRRKGRHRPKLFVGAAAIVLSGSIAALTSLHQERVRSERRSERELGIKTFADSSLADAREQLIKGRGALRASDTVAAMEAAGRAEQLLLELGRRKDPAERAILEEFEEEVERMTLRVAILRARARGRLDEPTAAITARRELEQLDSACHGDAELDAFVHAALGELHLLLGETPKAIGEFEKALSLYPRAWRAQVGLARAYALSSRHADAVLAYTQALRDLGDKGPAEQDLDAAARRALSARLLVERSAVRIPLGQAERALAEAQQALEAGGGVDAQLAIGRALEAQGNLLQASAAYGQAVPVAADPAHLLAHGWMLLRAGDLEQATVAVSSAEALDPRSLEAHLLRGELAYRSSAFEDARARATVVVNGAGPLDWALASRAHQLLARLFVCEGNLPKAYEEAKRAARLDPNSFEAGLLFAEVCADRYFEGQYLDAIERQCKRVIKANPLSLRARRLLAEATLRKFVSRPTRGRRQVEAALDIDGNDPGSLALLAEAYVLESKKTKGLAEKAERVLERANRYAQDLRRPSGLAYLEGLRAELDARRLEGLQKGQALRLADRCYARALRLQPNHRLAHLGRARLGLALGALRRAQTHLSRAVSSRQDPALNELLARQWIQAKEPTGSVRVRPRLGPAEPEEAIELQLWRAYLQVTESADGEALVEAARLAFEPLRARFPRSPLVLETEERILRERRARVRDGREALRARLERVGLEQRELLAQIGRRKEEAQAALKRAEEVLQQASWSGVEGPGTQPTEQAAWAEAVEAAERAALLGPSARAWSLLAQARDGEGDRWGAASAWLRASWLDPQHSGDLLEALQGLATRPTSAPPVDELLRDDEAGTTSRVQLAIQELPRVVASLRGPVDRDEAKLDFARLERIAARSPDRVVPPLLLGLFAYGVGREAYSLQQLGQVGVLGDARGAWRRVATLAARANRPGERDELLALRALRRALEKGMSPEQLEADPAFESLRGLPAWKELPR